MSSTNPHFTFHYSQPEDYRFSHDSVFLSRRVFEDYQSEADRALDLCAGCGIVGLDFLSHCQREGRSRPLRMDFLEVQSVYRDHFKRNATGFANVRFLNLNYSYLTRPEWRERYDLILCNPPYFEPKQGKLSPSNFKNRCRFFLDSDFATLVQAVSNSLSVEGQAYLLMRDLNDHGLARDQELRELLPGNLACAALKPIRGTPLLRLKKLRARL